MIYLFSSVLGIRPQVLGMLGKFSTPQGTYLVLNTDFGKTSLASLLTFYLKLLLRFNSRVGRCHGDCGACTAKYIHMTCLCMERLLTPDVEK